MDYIENVKTDIEAKHFEYNLNRIREYENQVDQGDLPENVETLVIQQKTSNNDQQAMTEVNKRLKECCQIGQLSEEDQAWNIKESVEKISEKMEEIKIQHNMTQTNKLEFFQKHEQTSTFYEAEIEYLSSHLTEKLLNNRTLYQGKLQELKDRIEMVRTTQDKQYQNIKNGMEQQLMNAQQLLAKLQNEQKELRKELNNLKEKEKKGSASVISTKSATTFDAPPGSQFKPKVSSLVNSHIPSVKDSQNVPGSNNNHNTSQTDNFDYLEDLLLNKFLQPMVYQTGPSFNVVVNNQSTKQVEIPSILDSLSIPGCSFNQNSSQRNNFDNFRDLVSNEFLQSMVSKTRELNCPKPNQVQSTLAPQNIQVLSTKNSTEVTEQLQHNNTKEQKLRPETVTIDLSSDDIDFIPDPTPRIFSVGGVKRRGPTLFTTSRKYFKRK